MPRLMIPRGTAIQVGLSLCGGILLVFFMFPELLPIDPMMGLILKIGAVAGLICIIYAYRREEKKLAPIGASLLDVARTRGWFQFIGVTKQSLWQAWVAGAVGFFFFAVVLPLILIGWDSRLPYIVATYFFIGPIVATWAYYLNGGSRCPFCQVALGAEVNHCLACGRQIFDQCPACQTSLPWGAHYCPICGLNLQDWNDKALEESPPATTPSVLMPKEITCFACGTQKGEGAVYCSCCGSIFNE